MNARPEPFSTHASRIVSHRKFRYRPNARYTSAPTHMDRQQARNSGDVILMLKPFDVSPIMNPTRSPSFPSTNGIRVARVTASRVNQARSPSFNGVRSPFTMLMLTWLNASTMAADSSKAAGISPSPLMWNVPSGSNSQSYSTGLLPVSSLVSTMMRSTLIASPCPIRFWILSDIVCRPTGVAGGC